MINQSTAEGHHVLHCAPKCWSRLMLCNWKWSTPKGYMLQYIGSRTGAIASTLCLYRLDHRVPAGWLWAGKGRDGRDVPTRMIPQVPKAPQAPPNEPSSRAIRHPCTLLARAPAAQLCLPVACPLWGERQVAPCVFPRHPCHHCYPCPSRPFWVRQVWTPPRKSGRGRGSPRCALPHLGDTTQTLLPCIASHHTAHATQTPNDNSTRHILISSNLSDPRMLHPLSLAHPLPSRRHAQHMTEPPYSTVP